MKRITCIALVAAALALSACGGGGGGGPVAVTPPVTTPPVTTPPPVANFTDSDISTAVATSVTSFIEFVRGLMTSETSEPVRLGAAVFPTSETAEPTP